jgi:CO/xanthine dehydrogenase Mo-binding subunit
VRGAPGRALTRRPRDGGQPIRYAYGKEPQAALRLVAADRLRAGTRQSPGLEATGYHAPSQAAFASGCHAAIVEVDVETGDVRVLRYVVQHDCGTMVNPTIVEGQIRGGVAQGIGGALYEKLACDSDGQPLTASYMDFLLPTAMDPARGDAHLETRSPLTPSGSRASAGGRHPQPRSPAGAIGDARASRHPHPNACGPSGCAG